MTSRGHVNFPRPLPGVKMRAKVDGQLWSAGSAEWRINDRPEGRYRGVLRHQGSPRWLCGHRHHTTEEARRCAAAELSRICESAELTKRLNP